MSHKIIPIIVIRQSHPPSPPTISDKIGIMKKDDKKRVKKKSVKASLTSSAGMKQRLSRMGKKQKKGLTGTMADYISRAQCLKMLQVSVKDFRRLCILKGVYPREPPGGIPAKKKSQTFYHVKDIRAIAHEPLLKKFRDFRAFMKKVRYSTKRMDLIVPAFSLFESNRFVVLRVVTK